MCKSCTIIKAPAPDRRKSGRQTDLSKPCTAFQRTSTDLLQALRQYDLCKVPTVFKYISRQFLHSLRHSDPLQFTVSLKDAFSRTGQSHRIVDTFQVGTSGKCISSYTCHTIRQRYAGQACTVIKTPGPDFCQASRKFQSFQ